MSFKNISEFIKVKKEIFSVEMKMCGVNKWSGGGDGKFLVGFGLNKLKDVVVVVVEGFVGFYEFKFK